MWKPTNPFKRKTPEEKAHLLALKLNKAADKKVAKVQKMMDKDHIFRDILTTAIMSSAVEALVEVIDEDEDGEFDELGWVTPEPGYFESPHPLTIGDLINNGPENYTISKPE